MYDIITIGDIKLDTFIVIPDASVMCQLKEQACKLCIEYGKKIPVQEITSQIAGSAPNVAVGLAKMKKSSAVMSMMGKDLTYDHAIKFLKNHKVDTRYIKAVKNRASSFSAVLNFKGESTQLVSHNEAEYKLPATPPSTKWIHVSELGGGYEKVFKKLSNCSKREGTRVSINPGTLQLKERKPELMSLIQCAHVLFVNKAEAQQLLQIKTLDPKVLIKKLKNLGSDYVVMTDGRNGAYAFDGKQLDYAPMFPGNRVEATGAGDAFTSGFLGAMMNKKTHREALMWGSVNAASVVQKVGPTAGLLSQLEIGKQLKARKSYKTKEL